MKNRKIFLVLMLLLVGCVNVDGYDPFPSMPAAWPAIDKSANCPDLSGGYDGVSETRGDSENDIDFINAFYVANGKEPVELLKKYDSSYSGGSGFYFRKSGETWILYSVNADIKTIFVDKMDKVITNVSCNDGFYIVDGYSSYASQLNESPYNKKTMKKIYRLIDGSIVVYVQKSPVKKFVFGGVDKVNHVFYRFKNNDDFKKLLQYYP